MVGLRDRVKVMMVEINYSEYNQPFGRSRTKVSAILVENATLVTRRTKTSPRFYIFGHA